MQNTISFPVTLSLARSLSLPPPLPPVPHFLPWDLHYTRPSGSGGPDRAEITAITDSVTEV